MILKSITLKNFKCFEDYFVSFDKINLIEGAIGIGKSTILEALIFALYGYSASTLSDLPTRNKAKSCKVAVLIENNGQNIEVIREYPLKLTIKEDEKTLKISTAEGNKYLSDKFGERLVFSQFRILDAYDKDSNFLEQGTTVLKKILFANTDTLFNEIRNNLNAIKLEREKYNKDSAVVFKLYPSEKRLQILKKGYEEISKNYTESDNFIVDVQQSINRKTSELSRNESKQESDKQNIERLNKQINNIDTIKSSYDNKLKDTEKRINNLQTIIKNCEQKCEELIKQENIIIEENKCYVCNKPLEGQFAGDIVKARMDERAEQVNNISSYNKELEDIQKQIIILKENIIKERLQKIEEFKKEIRILNEEILNLIETNNGLQEEIKMDNEVIKESLTDRNKFKKERDTIGALIIKLEGRLKQKEYIYTTKDIIVVKKAIEELDKLSSIYLIETINSLTPIIDSVLSKIDCQCVFDTNEKGKFEIILTREGIQYKYKDFSTGQRLLLQTAIKLALLMQQGSTGLVSSDEGLGSLDEETLQFVLNLFKELPFQLIFTRHGYIGDKSDINIINLVEKKDE